MKLMDEVMLESSVEALEALCAPFEQHPNWPAIRQNLQALRDVPSSTDYEAKMMAALLIVWRDCTPDEWAQEPQKLRDTLEKASRKLQSLATGMTSQHPVEVK